MALLRIHQVSFVITYESSVNQMEAVAVLSPIKDPVVGSPIEDPHALSPLRDPVVGSPIIDPNVLSPIKEKQT